MAVVRRRLGDIAKIYVGIPTKTSDLHEAGRSGNVLTVRSLTGNGIDPDELVRAIFDGRDLERYRVAAGDVLISARSTSLKTAVVPSELAGKVINATLVGVRCLPDLEPRLLVAWLNHPEGQAELANISQSATTQMNITVAGLTEIEVPVPRVEVQRQMVQVLEAADEAYTAAVRAAEARLRLAREIVVEQLKDKKECR